MIKYFAIIFICLSLSSCEKISPTTLGEPQTGFVINENYQSSQDGILTVSFTTTLVRHDVGVLMYMDEENVPTTLIGDLMVVPAISRNFKVLKNQYWRVEKNHDSINVSIVFTPVL